MWDSLEGVGACCCPWEHIGGVGGWRGEASRLQEWRKNEVYRQEMETCSSKTEGDESSNSFSRPRRETSQGHFAATRKITKMDPFL